MHSPRPSNGSSVAPRFFHDGLISCSMRRLFHDGSISSISGFPLDGFSLAGFFLCLTSSAADGLFSAIVTSSVMSSSCTHGQRWRRDNGEFRIRISRDNGTWYDDGALEFHPYGFVSVLRCILKNKNLSPIAQSAS